MIINCTISINIFLFYFTHFVLGYFMLILHKLNVFCNFLSELVLFDYIKKNIPRERAIKIPSIYRCLSE